jgi:hypothetical protein
MIGPRVRLALIVIGLGFAVIANAQLDPVRRDLIEAGDGRPLEGHMPVAAYGFYYFNRPQFRDPDLVLQAAVTPVYIDGELGIRNFFAPHVDLGIRLDGGGFAYGYNEFREGRWSRDESFLGHGGGVTLGVYRLFNPDERIPLNGIVQAGFGERIYERYGDTTRDFVLPRDQSIGNVRVGLRFGGVEPVLRPDLGAELSAWYEGQFRSRPGGYGIDGDRRTESNVHLFWARALLIYTFPDSAQQVSLGVNLGSSSNGDRLSAYRIGGAATLASEFPLLLPGYADGELSARGFVLGSGAYSVPLDAARRWRLSAGGSVARIAFTPGVPQAHKTNSGLNLGLDYHGDGARSWTASLVYGHALDAVRNGHHGSDSLALMVEIDLGHDDGQTR